MWHNRTEWIRLRKVLWAFDVLVNEEQRDEYQWWRCSLYPSAFSPWDEWRSEAAAWGFPVSVWDEQVEPLKKVIADFKKGDSEYKEKIGKKLLDRIRKESL